MDMSTAVALKRHFLKASDNLKNIWHTENNSGLANQFQNGGNVGAAPKIDWQGSLKIQTGASGQQTWGLYVSYCTLLCGVI